MTGHDKKTKPATDVVFFDGLQTYQKKQALQKLLQYASEEAARLGYVETDDKVIIAIGTLEKEYNSKLS